MSQFEENLLLAMQAHNCDSTTAIQNGFVESVRDRRENVRIEYERTEYKRKRAAEYPPVTDYLDALVKGDQAQIDAYVAACLAVKAKYPKPPEA
jgi:hypothetical protein